MGFSMVSKGVYDWHMTVLGLASSIIFPLENDSCPNRVGGISKNSISTGMLPDSNL